MLCGKTAEWTLTLLTFAGPPYPPRHFRIVSANTHSIDVQWEPGKDGGLKQTFTLKWTNTASGKVSEEKYIRVKSKQLMTFKIKENITPGRKYQIELFSVNRLGKSSGTPVTAKTKG